MYSKRYCSSAAASEGTAFTANELLVLRMFYAGVRARQHRDQFGVDPWNVVRRHRNLPVEQYHEVMALLNLAGARG